MSTATPEAPRNLRAGLIGGGCALIAFAGILFPSAPPAPPPATNAPPAEEAPNEKPVSSPWAAAPENRVTFAKTMPRAQGAQVFNNNGKPNPAMVQVAIPNGPKSVRFVRGDDPAAIRYLSRTTAAQKRIILDKGPRTLDTSEIVDFGPLKGRATRHARNLAADDGPKSSPPAVSAAVPPSQ